MFDPLPGVLGMPDLPVQKLPDKIARCNISEQKYLRDGSS
jgi:hypothetical protein